MQEFMREAEETVEEKMQEGEMRWLRRVRFGART